MTRNRRDYLVLSDIHIGSRNTSAEEICDHLKVFFSNFKVKDNFDDLKVIFIAGDLWDSSIEFSSPAIGEFFKFWYSFCCWAIRKDIEIIVMEGTGSHDAGQGINLEKLTRIATPDLKFRYINELCIQRVEVLNMDVLFIPDECRETTDMIYQDVQKAMIAAGITMVDIAIMHGMFTYQLGNIPNNGKISVHRENDYLNIVRYYISIGHIHTASFFERIYAQGSFDRLAHNEEEPKGAYYFAEEKPGQWTPVFLENKLAKKYITIRLYGNELDEALIEKTRKTLAKYPQGSFIRFKVATGSTFKENKTLFQKLFPGYIFSMETIDSKAKKPSSLKVDTSYARIALNKETLVPLLIAEVTERQKLDEADKNLLHKELTDIIGTEGAL